ncbi:MAG TPA: molybdopterin cofactor-binding domain-containing protein [Gemmatimonas sp.]|uniref:xanthine dehydrogenase family protein molybdopterin-binding subunit n=1 Tax=Gemmatimonas sp. TaxID=1962908 RepID=UPI002ED98DE3
MTPSKTPWLRRDPRIADADTPKAASSGLDRREFLTRMAASGLVLAISASGIGCVADMAASGSFEPSVFLRIGEDGIVTVIVHRSEMGQGVRTGLAMAMADELEADWSMVRIEQAIGDAKYGDQNTDGSTSIRNGGWMTFRQAGAAARAMLQQAAADEWKVPVGEVQGTNGEVVHAASNLRASYGSLVKRASKLAVPKDAPLKKPEQYRYIGKTVASLDLQSMVTGTAKYAQDLSMPGMRIAVIARPPVYGAKVKSVDSAAAKQVKGVERVIEVPSAPVPSGMMPLGGVAIVATSTWAAIEARKKLVIEWTESPNDSHDSAAYRTELEGSVRAAGNVVRDLGDAASAVAGATRKVTAEYYVPHLAHVPMEPPAAMANFANSACEVWACTQDPQTAQGVVAGMVGIDKSKVTVNVTFLGGAFGRKSKPDFIAEAAFLSKEMKTPVKVVWTREDDIQNGFPHTISMQRLEAGLDAKGKIVGMVHRIASPPIGSTFGPDQEYHSEGELGLGVLDMPFAIPNVRVEVCKAPPHSRIGWYRSVSNIPHAFALGCFMDELAQAAGKDPVQFLIESLGGDRVIDMTATGAKKPVENYGAKWEDHPNDTARHRRVLEMVAKESGWGTALPAGEGRGVAVHRSFLTYVAAVVRVKVASDGTISVPRVDIAMDCGYAAHPDRVRSQCEGAVIMSLSNAMLSELTFARGRVVQSNLNDYRVLRMAGAPKDIRVHLVDAVGPIGGVGEPGVPPVAPAFANAVFAARRTRVRSLPAERA